MIQDVPFSVVVYTGREPERIVGPFSTQHEAADWCANERIDVGAHVSDDDRQRGFVLPFNPRT